MALFTRVIDNSDDSGDGNRLVNGINEGWLRGHRARDFDTTTRHAARQAAGRRAADMNAGRTRGSRNRGSDD